MVEFRGRFTRVAKQIQSQISHINAIKSHPEYLLLSQMPVASASFFITKPQMIMPGMVLAIFRID